MRPAAGAAESSAAQVDDALTPPQVEQLRAALDGVFERTKGDRRGGGGQQAADAKDHFIHNVLE